MTETTSNHLVSYCLVCPENELESFKTLLLENLGYHHLNIGNESDDIDIGERKPVSGIPIEGVFLEKKKDRLIVALAIKRTTNPHQPLKVRFHSDEYEI